MTNSIIAPYSFVPLSKKIFAPDWAYSVSHDVPLKDSLSGYIELKLENHGDICVGAGLESRKDISENGEGKKKDVVVWARLPGDKDRLVIPGSSVKGMIRNVLEIVSLARLTPESMYQVRKFSHRFLGKTKNGEVNDYIKELTGYDCCSAWLKYNLEKECWEIRKSKSDFQLVKIFDDKLNKFLGLGSEDKISNPQPAKEKYKKAESSNKKLNLNTRVAVDCINVPASGYVQAYKEVTSISIASPDEKTGEKHCTGYVVFSNHRIGNNQDQKCFSYIFPDDKLQPPVEVSADIVEKFSSVSQTIRELHKYLLSNQNSKLGIPVWAFSDKDSGEVKVLGYPKMPRLPCKRNTKEVTANHQSGFKEEEWDVADEIYFSLPEVMFGTVRKKFGGVSLKSRVCFSDMISEKVSESDLDDNVTVVLNEPKPSFTAMYLEDNQTYSAKDLIPRASGFKRYRCQECSTTGTAGKDGVSSTMEVLRNKKTFTGKIMFHNLKKEELGALLWCLKFGEKFANDQNGQNGDNGDNGDNGQGSPSYYHNLGHGKPYGLGAVQFNEVSVEVADYDSFGFKSKSPEELDAFVADFEKLMDSEFAKIGCKEAWKDSLQVSYLKSLALLYRDYKKSSQVYNNLGDFDGLRNSPMPQVFNLVTGKPLPRKDIKDKQLPGKKELNEKYLGNVNYGRLLQRVDDTLKTKCYDDYLEQLKAREAAIEEERAKEAKLSEIDCEVLRNFISKFDDNLEVLPNSVQAQDIIQFLKDMIKAPKVNDKDRDLLDSILKSGWFSKFVNVSNKKNKDERKALVRQVKEKHAPPFSKV